MAQSQRALCRIRSIRLFHPTTMRAVASLLALAVFAPAVLANYFTAPTTSTVWTTSSGQTLLWKQQAGSPSVGTFRISTAE